MADPVTQLLSLSSSDKHKDKASQPKTQTSSNTVKPISRGLALAEKQIIDLASKPLEAYIKASLVTTAAQREAALARPAEALPAPKPGSPEGIMARLLDGLPDGDTLADLTSVELGECNKRLNEHNALMEKNWRRSAAALAKLKAADAAEWANIDRMRQDIIKEAKRRRRF